MISPFLPGLCRLDRHDLLHLFVETVYPSSVFSPLVLPRLVVGSVVLSFLFVSSFELCLTMSKLGHVLGLAVVPGLVSTRIRLY